MAAIDVCDAFDGGGDFTGKGRTQQKFAVSGNPVANVEATKAGKQRAPEKAGIDDWNAKHDVLDCKAPIDCAVMTDN